MGFEFIEQTCNTRHACLLFQDQQNMLIHEHVLLGEITWKRDSVLIISKQLPEKAVDSKAVH